MTDTNGETQRIKALKDITTAVYALQAVGFLIGVTFIAAVIINYIKLTDVTGTLARPNTFGGIQVQGSSRNTIGGTVPAARNLISGNQQRGVLIANADNLFGLTAPSNNNLVAGNLIGTNAAGTAALANQGNGVLISSGASANTVGGLTASSRNVISGNTGVGVGLNGGGTSGNSSGGSSARTSPGRAARSSQAARS